MTMRRYLSTDKSAEGVVGEELLIEMKTHHAPQQMAETRILSLTSVGPCRARVLAIFTGPEALWYTQKIDLRGLSF